MTHRLREQFQQEFAAKQVALEQTISLREKKLQQAQRDMEDEVGRKLEAERKKLTDQVETQARQASALEVQTLQAQLASRAKQLDEARANELALRTQKTALEERSQNLDLEVTRKVEAEKKRLTESALAQARQAQEVEMKALQSQLSERGKELELARQNELALIQRKNEIEARAQSLELEVARKLESERTKVRDEARQQALDEQQLKIADKEKLIHDLTEKIQVLQRKAEQGSQQSQGEVLELQLEDLLRQSFPLDEIVPVSIGVRGADLLHRVRDNLGQVCGTIIWESKRTKSWQQSWLPKLKDDARAQGADVAILVSEVLPQGVTNSGLVEGVWVTGFTFAVALAAALRSGLQSVAAARRAESGKDEKMEVLYQFVTSPQFRRQVEGVLEAFVEMKNDLDAERRAMERLWKKREAQIARIMNGTSGQYGSLQGIVGSTALPEIKTLELGAE